MKELKQSIGCAKSCVGSKALATEDAYVHWLRRHIKALPQMLVGLSSEKKLEKFLTHLAIKQVGKGSNR